MDYIWIIYGLYGLKYRFLFVMAIDWWAPRASATRDCTFHPSNRAWCVCKALRHHRSATHSTHPTFEQEKPRWTDLVNLTVCYGKIHCFFSTETIYKWYNWAIVNSYVCFLEGNTICLVRVLQTRKTRGVVEFAIPSGRRIPGEKVDHDGTSWFQMQWKEYKSSISFAL